jgi:2,3-dihydroxybenzoate-AMP ligase
MLAGAVPFSAERARQYRAAGLWNGSTFPAMLHDSVLRRGEHVAVVDASGCSLTYRQLEHASRVVAARMRAAGVGDRDRVVLQLPNVLEFLPVLFGVFRIGAVPVFALPAHRRESIAHFVRHADAVALITVERHLRDPLGDVARAVQEELRGEGRELLVITHPEQLMEEPADGVGEELTRCAAIDAEDVAFLQLSGGTTGTPKMIPRTSDDYMLTLRLSDEICAVDQDAVYLAALPIAHNFTMSSPGVLGTLRAGGTVVVAPTPAPDVCLPLIRRERVTITALVPPMALLWARHVPQDPDVLASLRTLLIGGAKLTDAAAERIAAAMPCRLQQVFGMAEGLVNYTRLDDPLEVVLHTQGRPMSEHDEIRIVDEQDRPVPRGTVGDLLTRGPYTINGYYRAEETNRVSFTSDGFYRTGDLVRMREDGCLVVEGRSKDLINRAGEKIVAAHVEDVLLRDRRILDVLVVPVPDDVLGERVVAVLRLQGHALPADALEPAPAEVARRVRRQVRDSGLPAFCAPDECVLAGDFPMTAVGKSSRRDLRRMLARRIASAAS